MAKPKSPLLSLGASGTIGDALTFQKKGRDTIAREKPIPKDPYSLNQAYQRWDYKDYAYLWTLLSNSEKQIYRTRASRYHITGFSQWMRENLKTLPYLAGRWHLDERGEATAHDSSKNNNNGTIFGASPATGLIAGCHYFDGVNDVINCGTDSTLDITEAISLEAFFQITEVARYHTIIAKASNTYSLEVIPPKNIRLLLRIDGAWRQTNAIDISIDTWYHVVGSYNESHRTLRLYLNGILQTSITLGGLATYKINSIPANPLYIGYSWGVRRMKGFIDEAAVHNEDLDPTIILRHSERRYLL